jgi:hypothetical protein
MTSRIMGSRFLAPDEIRHDPHKSGTTACHIYATLAVVHHARRYPVALSFVWADESMAPVVERVLTLKNKLNLRVRRAAVITRPIMRRSRATSPTPYSFVAAAASSAR